MPSKLAGSARHNLVVSKHFVRKSASVAPPNSFDEEDIRVLAEYFLKEFRVFFDSQPEGSLPSSITLELSRRMRQRVGLAFLFENKIRLNLHYFLEKPHLLPYTLFHELTHLWLYHCKRDPGHTERFYKKMQEFKQTGFPVDPEIHVHTRVAPEAKYIYICSKCDNRWFLKDRVKQPIFCGFCFKREGVEYYAELHNQFMTREAS